MKLQIKAEFLGKVRLEDGNGSFVLDASVSQDRLADLFGDEQLTGFVEPVLEVAAPADRPVINDAVKSTQK